MAVLPSVLAMLDLDRPRGTWLLEHPRGEAGSRDRRALRNNMVVPAAKRASLEPVTTHDLRHTAASLAIAAGADVKMIQAMLGHASATLTMDTYGHLFEGGLDGVQPRRRACSPINSATQAVLSPLTEVDDPVRSCGNLMANPVVHHRCGQPRQVLHLANREPGHAFQGLLE